MSARVSCVCQWCDSTFTLPACRLKIGMGKTCEACRHPSIEQRFWRKLDTSGECWTWTGSRHPTGHGYIYWNGKLGYAHRLAWELARGPIPDGLVICHKCDNPPCVNPSHLFIGTQGDNMADAAVKGRVARGERRPQSKLTTSEVLAIRKAAASGVRQSVLAKQYGVTHGAIGFIVRRERWEHV